MPSNTLQSGTPTYLQAIVCLYCELGYGGDGNYGPGYSLPLGGVALPTINAPVQQVRHSSPLIYLILILHCSFQVPMMSANHSLGSGTPNYLQASICLRCKLGYGGAVNYASQYSSPLGGVSLPAYNSPMQQVCCSSPLLCLGLIFNIYSRCRQCLRTFFRVVRLLTFRCPFSYTVSQAMVVTVTIGRDIHCHWVVLLCPHMYPRNRYAICHLSQA